MDKEIEKVAKIVREQADRLNLGKKSSLDWQDWKNLRAKLLEIENHFLVSFLDSLVNEKDFEQFMTNVIYK